MRVLALIAVLSLASAGCKAKSSDDSGNTNTSKPGSKHGGSGANADSGGMSSDGTSQSGGSGGRGGSGGHSAQHDGSGGSASGDPQSGSGGGGSTDTHDQHAGSGGETSAGAHDAGTGGTAELDAALIPDGGALMPGMGSCCMEHDTPGCSNADLEVCVCEKLTACCTDAWSAACVLIVQQKYCQPGVRDCVCGSDDGQWNQPDCCLSDWDHTFCDQVAISHCGAEPGCL